MSNLINAGIINDTPNGLFCQLPKYRSYVREFIKQDLKDGIKSQYYAHIVNQREFTAYDELMFRQAVELYKKQGIVEYKRIDKTKILNDFYRKSFDKTRVLSAELIVYKKVGDYQLFGFNDFLSQCLGYLPADDEYTILYVKGM